MVPNADEILRQIVESTSASMSEVHRETCGVQPADDVPPESDGSDSSDNESSLDVECTGEEPGKRFRCLQRLYHPLRACERAASEIVWLSPGLVWV